MRGLYLLPQDRKWAEQRIAEIEQAIHDLGEEFYEVFNQSSETWHDNAPFEVVRDRQSVLSAEQQALRKILHDSTLEKPKQKRGAVGIGSQVALSDGSAYSIAGDWTPHSGKKVDGVTTISARSPLAQQLMGGKVGTVVQKGAKQLKINTLTHIRH